MLQNVAAKHLDQLDSLPRDLGHRIRELEQYDFMEASAARPLQRACWSGCAGQLLDQYMDGLSEAIRNTTPEDLAANREMVRDLNRLLQERLAGGDPDASEFLAKHGRFFPGAQNLDDVIEQLAERMAAMQSLLRSMSAEQRAELQSMVDALLRDDRLRWDLAQLAATLDQLLPGGLGERFRFSGDERLGLEGALQQMANLQSLDTLEGAARRHRAARRTSTASTATGCATCSATTRPATSPPSTTSRASSSAPATSSGRAIGSSSRRRAAAGSGRRCSTTCSAGCDATRSAAIGSTGPAGRRAGGDHEAVRVRRPVPSRPQPDARQRAPARGERAGPAPRGRPRRACSSTRRTSRCSGPSS